MSFTDFFHRLLNPHCEYCRQGELERIERAACKTCEALRAEIEDLRKDKAYIFARIFEQTREAVSQPTSTPQSILGKNIPWSKVRRELEAKDAELARQEKLRAAQESDENKSTEQLEKELLGGEEENEDNP
jgi:hypothetical protein